MTAPTEPEPEPRWLSAWLAGGKSPLNALDAFDDLPAADPSELAGLWRGRSLPTGHPLDGLLESLDWYGKSVLPGGRVYPLLFRRPAGRVVALNPAWMPVEIALRLPDLARSPPTRAVFRALCPLLRTRSPSARVEVREVHGRRGAAIVYDRQPIVDHLRRLDASRLVGLMERPGMKAPYFFLLRREATS